MGEVNQQLIVRNKALKSTPHEVTCPECGDVVVRLLSKYVPTSRGYPRAVYVDHSGRQFNGRQCPDCKYGSVNVKLG